MEFKTIDPAIIIEEQNEIYIRYRNIETRRRWEVYGKCNQCGLCCVGAVPQNRFKWIGPIGTPYAVIDLLYGIRNDEPCTPEMESAMKQMASEIITATVSGCSLTFKEL